MNDITISIQNNNVPTINLPDENIIGVNVYSNTPNISLTMPSAVQITTGDSVFIKAYISNPLSPIEVTSLDAPISVSVSSISQINQLQSDWNQTNISLVDYIKNKPTIPTALSQLTDDSTHRLVTDTEKSIWNNPPSGQINSDWNATSGVAVILNKPSIPSKTSELTNDSNFIVDAFYVHTDNNFTNSEQLKLSGIQSGAEVNVNSDWDASSGDAQILNKPSIPAAQIQSDWNQSNNALLDYIKNKPNIPTALSELADDTTHRLVTDTEKSIWNGKLSTESDPIFVAFRDTVRPAGTFYGGPATGADAAPTFRAFVAADIPAGIVSPGSLANASAQYKYLVSGATPFAYAESAGGLNIASGKTLTVSETLTLTAAGASASLTLPNLAISLAGGVAAGVYTLPNTAGGGMIALLNEKNVFSVDQQINGKLAIGIAPVSAFSFQVRGNAALNFDRADGYGIFMTQGNTINSDYAQNFTSTLFINYVGYLAGTTQFRNFQIDNGKGGLVTYFDGTNGNVFIGSGATIPVPVRLHLKDLTATTNAIREVQRIEAVVSTAATGASNGFGVASTYRLETATDGVSQQAAQIAALWVDSTNLTRKGKLQLSAFDTIQRIGIEIEASGTAVKLGFFGGTNAAQQVLSAYTTNAQNSAYTGIDNLQIGTVYAQLADLNALRVAYENVRGMVDDLRTKLQTSTIVA